MCTWSLMAGTALAHLGRLAVSTSAMLISEWLTMYSTADSPSES